MDRQTSAKLNLIRIISMIMIVLCHYFQFYGNQLAFSLNVGVQVFFILSGVLYGCKDVEDYKKFWKNKLFKLYLPYITIIIVFFMANLILHKSEMGLLDLVYYLTATQVFNVNVGPIAHLWFMSYIFLFYLLIPVLQKFDFSRSKCFYPKLILLIIALQFFQFVNIFNINVSYLALFVSSYYFSRRKFKYNINTDNYSLILGLSAFVCVVGMPTERYLQSLNLEGVMDKFFWVYHDYIHAFLGIALVIIMIKLLPAIKNKATDYLANVSFYIYLVHHVFILGGFSMLYRNNGLVLSVLVILILSNVLYIIFGILPTRLAKRKNM